MIKYFVGLPPLEYLESIENLDYLCKEYKDLIDTWYISPPFERDFSSRKGIYTEGTEEEIKNLKLELDCIRENNQKIQLALNTKMLKGEKAIEGYYKFIEIFGKVDSIVATKELIEPLSKLNIPLTYSFNNPTPNNPLLEKCDTVVFGKQYIRNIDLMKKLKEEYNVKIELLVNNGCHFYCTSKCKDCTKFLNKRLHDVGILDAFSESTVFPYELDYYPEGLIDIIKISSRPSTVSYINNTMNLYKNRVKYVEKDSYRNVSRLVGFYPYFKNFNTQEILDKKEEIWKSIKEKTTQVN